MSRKRENFWDKSAFVIMSAGCRSVDTKTGAISSSSTASLKKAHSIPKCLNFLCGAPGFEAREMDAVLSS